MLDETAYDYPKVLFLQKYLVGHKGYIAGGCFKHIFSDEKVKDVDIFFESEADFSMGKIYFQRAADSQEVKLYKKTYESKNAIGFTDLNTGVNIDLVRSRFMKNEEMIKSFDFTITKFSLYNKPTIDFEGTESVELKVLYHEKFFEHLVLKRLVVDDTMSYPLGTFERTYRYYGYGFRMCKETKKKLITTINGLVLPETELFKSLYDGID